jgi:hypothetical protein
MGQSISNKKAAAEGRGYLFVNMPQVRQRRGTQAGIAAAPETEDPQGNGEVIYTKKDGGFGGTCREA